MRTCALLLVLLTAVVARAQVPAAGPAQPDEQVAGADLKSAGVPAGAQDRRNWLLARLIVDQNFDREKIRSIEQGLAQMSPDQLDVLVRVYQERLQQRKTSEQSELAQAQANLEQTKAYRNVLAQHLDNLSAFRQAQYLSFGTWYGRFGGFGSGGLGYGGMGYGGMGYGGMGYGGMGYGGMGYGGMGYGGYGYGSPGYGAYGYGPAYAYPAYGYGMGMPGYGAGYGGNMSGMGAGY